MQSQREILHSKLPLWCNQEIQGLPYYRPLVCRDAKCSIDLLVVGTNPKKEIWPNDWSLDKYCSRLIGDWNGFLEMYGKNSYTRGRIDQIVEELKGINFAIGESNAYAFPTSDSSYLKAIFKEIRSVKEHCDRIFCEMIAVIQPRWIVFHGKPALKSLASAISKFDSQASNIESKWSLLDQNSPRYQVVGEFKYLSGKQVTVGGGRHFADKPHLPKTKYYSDILFSTFCKSVKLSVLNEQPLEYV